LREEHVRLHLQGRINRYQDTSAKAGWPSFSVIFSSETSVDFQRTTRPYIPEYRTPHECSRTHWRVEQRLVFTPLFTSLQLSYVDVL
jgi:hypothetical protein